MFEARGERILKMIKSYGLLLLVAVWILLVGGGMKILANYQNAPGQTAHAQTDWPAQSRFSRSTNSPTLVMFAHPQCPCTRASLSELARIMAQCDGKLAARVVFLKPSGMSETWLHSDSWGAAAAIPGVQVERDEKGVLANEFDAKTSGQVLVYDVTGRLVFSGGITDSRGHEGDNAGSEAIVSLVSTGRAKNARTPVFGCAIFTPAEKSLAHR